jgi:hypothetical protein
VAADGDAGGEDEREERRVDAEPGDVVGGRPDRRVLEPGTGVSPLGRLPFGVRTGRGRIGLGFGG